MPRALPPNPRRPVGTPGPSEPPAPPRPGLLAAAVAVARLPADLLVAAGYLVREFPYLVQDLRSAVNDVARLAHDGALREVLDGLARAADADGELAHALREGGNLAAARAELEHERISQDA